MSPPISVDCQYVDIKIEDETEINYIKKKSSSPRQRRKTKTVETVGIAHPHSCGSERLRRSSREPPRHSDKDNVAETMITSPNSKFTFGSPSSSRASSPERPLPKLTCMEEKHIASTCEVFDWSLIPNELYFQVPAPPSLIYGAQHLLRLFGKWLQFITLYSIFRVIIFVNLKPNRLIPMTVYILYIENEYNRVIHAC